MNCPFCGTAVDRKLDLGQLPLANRYPSIPDPVDEFFYHSEWGWCPDCGLFQQMNPVPAGQIFDADYPYLTGTSQAMLNHFEQAARDLTSRYNPASMIEIGCNDGGLLQFMNCQRLGYEMASACWPQLDQKHIPYDRRPFGDETVDLVSGADLIYAANTLRSISDWDDIFDGIDFALSEDGVVVVEEPYLMSMLAKAEFDQLYDECVYYLTISSMASIADRYGFSLHDVDYLTTHGGSVRYHLKRKLPGDVLSRKISMAIYQEGYIPDRIGDLQTAVSQTTEDLSLELSRLVAEGDRIVGYGATAKSTVILNLIKATSGWLPCIYDTSPTKWDRYTPGTHIPIVNADLFLHDPAERVLLLAWNHGAEIIRRENTVNSRLWLTYVPSVRYINGY